LCSKLVGDDLLKDCLGGEEATTVLDAERKTSFQEAISSEGA
jgi:hypothetical protein